jgi:hypothetical protein
MPPRTNSPRNTTSKRPADFTGQLQQRQQKELSDEEKAHQLEMTRINAEKQLHDSEEIDMTLEANPVDVAPEVVVKSPKVHGVRVNYPIEDMTYGRIITDPGDPENGVSPIIGPLRVMSFEEGKSYTMDRDVYEHLDAKGYIWH